MMALLAAESKASLSDRIIGPPIQLAALSGASLLLALGFKLSVAALFSTSSELDAFWIALALPKANVNSIHLGVPTILFILIFNIPSDPADPEDPVDPVDPVTNVPNAKDSR